MTRKQPSFIWLELIFCVAICFYSCKNERPAFLPNEKIEKESDRFDVSPDDARTIALQYHLAEGDSAGANKRTGAGQETIVSEMTIVDSIDQRPLLYIIQKSRGFIIVSASFHTMPVLAFSDQSPIDLRDIPAGIQIWLETAREKIRDARRTGDLPDPIVTAEWEKFLARKLKTSDSNCIEWYQYGQFQCKNKSTTKGPLLTTAWGQEALATTQLSTAGNCDGCGRRYAGCGPVAMAQIEEYYHPNPLRPRISKDKCTATTAGEISLGALMQQMGAKANASYNYMGTCNTFTWPNDVKSGLKSFGYASGGSGSEAYNYSLIKNELSGNHPLIFWGSTCLSCFSNYHIWVCEGYQENFYSDFNCTTKQCNEWSFSYLRMNWGWNGDWNDYYAFGAYTPKQQDYNANLHVIYNIRP